MFQHTKLSLQAPEALFQNKTQGLVALSYQNECPPQGLMGQMDWYFKGQISEYFRSGFLTGTLNECTYLPVLSSHYHLTNSSHLGTSEKTRKVYHLIFIGQGISPGREKRLPLKKNSISILIKNILSLKLTNIGISSSDCGNVSFDFFETYFKELPLWISP